MEKTSRARVRNKIAVETLLAKPVRQIPKGGLATLRRKARECHACGLWKHATQTVFGAGADHARIMLIGEQPGQQEDIQGLPFVGPAGRLLDRALEEAQVDRGTLYLTNTVKHFKYELRGKVRLHKRANAAEQEACRMWLAAELALLQPRIVSLRTLARSPSARVCASEAFARVRYQQPRESRQNRIRMRRQQHRRLRP